MRKTEEMDITDYNKSLDLDLILWEKQGPEYTDHMTSARGCDGFGPSSKNRPRL